MAYLKSCSLTNLGGTGRRGEKSFLEGARILSESYLPLVAIDEVIYDWNPRGYIRPRELLDVLLLHRLVDYLFSREALISIPPAEHILHPVANS